MKCIKNEIEKKKKKFLNLYNKMHENAKEKLIKCIKMKCIKNTKEKKKYFLIYTTKYMKMQKKINEMH